MTTVVDGDVGNQATESRNGTHFGFDQEEGVLAMFEAVWRLTQGNGVKSLPGTYTLGGWYHSGKLDDLRRDTRGSSLEDDGTLFGLSSSGTAASHMGNGGLYSNVDQMLWREKAGLDEGLGLYFRVAPWMPTDRNATDFYVAGGLIYKGLVPSRDEDMFGVALAYVGVSNSVRDAQRDANRIAAAVGTPNNLEPGPVPDCEMSLEATYRIILALWRELQPDFQYIFHPGGSVALRDAIVVGLRMSIAL